MKTKTEFYKKHFDNLLKAIEKVEYLENANYGKHLEIIAFIKDTKHILNNTRIIIELIDKKKITLPQAHAYILYERFTSSNYTCSGSFK